MTSRSLVPAAALSLGWAAVLAACGANVVVDPARTTGTGATGGAQTTSSVTTSVGGSVGVTTSSTTASSNGTTTSTSSTTSTTTTSSTGVTSSTSSSASGSVCPSQPPQFGPCSPMPGPCPPAIAKGSACLAEIPQAANPVFGMRIAHMTFFTPAAFLGGVVANVIDTAIEQDFPMCNLFGQGTFSWLLQFDTQKGVIRTGGAKPVSGPFLPYTFVNEIVVSGGMKFNVAPVEIPVPLASLAACKFTSSTADVVIPMYLDPGGVQSILLPLHQLQYKGNFSGDHECIGTYNGAGLDPASMCQPDASHPQFIDGAKLSAFFLIAETDNVLVPQLNESLCVLLSNNAGQYGDGGNPAHCMKSATNQILFQGDWCSTTNSPATGTCHDALQLNAGFAASAVPIN